MTAQMDFEQVKNMSPEERARYDAQVEGRIIRFEHVRPNWLLSPNCLLPGHERANFVYIGEGSYLNWPTDGSTSHTAPVVPGENYSMTILLCAPGKGAPLHAHTTEETFLVLNGRWAVYWGNDGSREVILNQWDAISFPGPVMRAFRNVGTDDAYLLSIIGGGSPPPPIPHPRVTEDLAKMGLGPSWSETNKR
jgi:mannose-6-phosphate isomerase-like protein (cupin superfamily)